MTDQLLISPNSKTFDWGKLLICLSFAAVLPLFVIFDPDNVLLSLFVLVCFGCIALLSRLYSLFKLRYLTLPGCFLIYYFIRFFPSSIIIYLQEAGDARYAFIVSHCIFILSFTIGVIIALGIVSNYKRFETKIYYLKSFVTESSSSLKTYYCVIFLFAFGIFALYLFYQRNLPFFYAMSNPGEVLKIAQLRDESHKLLDIGWLKYSYGWAKHVLFPFLMVFTFVNYQSSKRKTWLSLFIFSLMLSITVSVLNFEKGPIVKVFALLFLIQFLMSYKKWGVKKVITVSAIGFVIMFAVPAIMIIYWAGLPFNLGSLWIAELGILKRLFWKGVSLQYNYFTLFPIDGHTFLHGAGIRPLAQLLNLEHFPVVRYAYHELVGGKLQSGNASTGFFVLGYVDFGYFGVFIMSTLMGIFLGVLHVCFVRAKKNTTNFSIYMFFMILSMGLFSHAITVWLLTSGVVVMFLLRFLKPICDSLNKTLRLSIEKRESP
ncbi:MAG: O-antigen polymerase [Candidatus Theseobacter exili]|nr:O-antigen polymerase [Candidatus Theseobacter exili]